MGKLSVQEFCTAELVSNGLVRSVPISHVAVFPVSQGLAVVRYEQGTWTVMDGDVMCAFPYGQTRRCQRGPGIIAKLSMATQQDSSCCACTHTHTDSYRLNEEASILSIKCKDLLCISSALSNSKRQHEHSVPEPALGSCSDGKGSPSFLLADGPLATLS